MIIKVIWIPPYIRSLNYNILLQPDLPTSKPAYSSDKARMDGMTSPMSPKYLNLSEGLAAKLTETVSFTKPEAAKEKKGI